jgi:hypothetical protein
MFELVEALTGNGAHLNRSSAGSGGVAILRLL